MDCAYRVFLHFDNAGQNPKTDSVAVIEAVLKRAEAHTLVVFDVDGVLIVPRDVILQPQNKAALTKLNEFNAVGEGDGLSAKQGVLPAYENGIVFTSAASKGDTLRAFLEYAHVSPRKIICIDDKRSHLESVGKVAAELGIEFVGIEYIAVKTRYIECETSKRSVLQFKVLNAENRGISDEAADALLATDDGA
jgi:hypothetical protein